MRPRCGSDGGGSGAFPHLDAGQRDALYRQGGRSLAQHNGALPLAFVQAYPARPGRPKRAMRSRCGCWPPSRWPGCLTCPACRSRRRWPGPAFLSQPMAAARAVAARGGAVRPRACPPSWISAARVRKAGPRAAGHVDGPGGAAAVALGSRASARLYRADRCRAACRTARADHGGRHAVVDGHHRRACGLARRCPSGGTHGQHGQSALRALGIPHERWRADRDRPRT